MAKDSAHASFDMRALCAKHTLCRLGGQGSVISDHTGSWPLS